MSASSFLRHADKLSAQIRRGTLKAGTRLPPVRDYAYEHGMAVSTAARVYAELVRRGLVAGHVGRGTFVRPPVTEPRFSEPGHLIDLEFNAAGLLPEEALLFRGVMEQSCMPDVLAALGNSASAYASTDVRATFAWHLHREAWSPEAGHLLIAGSGRQAIAGSFAALTEPGASIGIEATTYPMTRAIARRLGRTVIPLAMDADGVLPDAIADARQNHEVRVVYLQPVLHNPLGMTMSPARRAAIAETLVRHDVTLIEDVVYGFLAPDDGPPIAALAPDHVILIDSLSKRGFSGMPLGLLVIGNRALRDRVAGSLRSGAWLAAPLSVAIGCGMITSQALSTFEANRRVDARHRQSILRHYLPETCLQSDVRSYHAWLRLPDPWRPETFCAAALREGIALTPATSFTVQPSHTKDAVRLALAKPTMEQLDQAMSTLRRLLDEGNAYPIY
ncbi:aminotransferase-like domain-containing protein [Acetobacter oeni]|uniref:Transcriptional regulator n=1 Tax=Acetobacter oeni TaxID=304077 RepID=A0A511XMS1_9PROT|nr:PLP-dependent aminotransferase family protein [Acetobacter oeni]MBB3882860.1 DNA-binding transcriptional MocR family regulator [Acetobacter oeni]NHO18946.1 aminotransferase class I/II-fold pyridoxal phosphate-dependent enzyme [Acetobacter oeni]GBR01786.1 GntR family transcriptional regulator [Acetobacter oeni LMG 21952]GEN64239.1 transcriptional regulator [Acetobacter oeni]